MTIINGLQLMQIDECRIILYVGIKTDELL